MLGTRTADGVAPDSIVREHRSQSPQVPRTHVLALTTGDRRTLTATAALLDAEGAVLDVGGLRTKLKAKHLAGLRDWAARLDGARPVATTR